MKQTMSNPPQSAEHRECTRFLAHDHRWSKRRRMRNSNLLMINISNVLSKDDGL